MEIRKSKKVMKAQLVSELSDQTTISKVQCDFMFETLVDIVKEHLLNEEEVELKSLGRFYFLSKREVRSNMTNELIPAHKQVKFKVADRFSRRIRQITRED